jgi:hypothetical protein
MLRITAMTPSYKVVQIWPGQTVTCLHTNSPGHIWTTLYLTVLLYKWKWPDFSSTGKVLCDCIATCTSDSNTYVVRQSQCACGLRWGLRPIACWDCGFEYRREARISVCCECFVFSGRYLCGGPILRPEESYRLRVRLNECDYENLKLRRTRPTRAVDLREKELGFQDYVS